MLGKTKVKVKVLLDIGCSAVRIGVIQENEGREAKFLLLERESFAPQSRLLDNPTLVAQALLRLRERVLEEYGLAFNSAYVGLRGDYVQSSMKNDVIHAADNHVKRNDVQQFFRKIEQQYQQQTETLLHLEYLGLSVRDEQSGQWRTVPLNDEMPYPHVQAWWVEVLARDEGQRVARELGKMAKLQKIDGFFAHHYALAQSALRLEERMSKVLLIDLGASSSEMVLLKNGLVVFTGVAEGGVALSHALSRRLHLTYQEAEASKIEGYAHEVLVEQYAEQIFKPLKSALTQGRGDSIVDLKQVILAGGGACPAAQLAAEQVFACAARYAEVERLAWERYLPESSWEQDYGHNHLREYLPLLGMYQHWYLSVNNGLSVEEAKPKKQSWLKKLFD